MDREEIIEAIREIADKINQAQESFNPVKAWDRIDEAKGLLVGLKVALQVDEEGSEIIDADDIEIGALRLSEVIECIREWCERLDNRIDGLESRIQSYCNPTNKELQKLVTGLHKFLGEHGSTLFTLERLNGNA
jgi:hypothetical protein